MHLLCIFLLQTWHNLFSMVSIGSHFFPLKEVQTCHIFSSSLQYNICLLEIMMYSLLSYCRCPKLPSLTFLTHGDPFLPVTVILGGNSCPHTCYFSVSFSFSISSPTLSSQYLHLFYFQFLAHWIFEIQAHYTSGKRVHFHMYSIF